MNLLMIEQVFICRPCCRGVERSQHMSRGGQGQEAMRVKPPVRSCARCRSTLLPPYPQHPELCPTYAFRGGGEGLAEKDAARPYETWICNACQENLRLLLPLPPASSLFHRSHRFIVLLFSSSSGTIVVPRLSCGLPLKNPL
jgi:hypothetical protein